VPPVVEQVHLSPVGDLESPFDWFTKQFGCQNSSTLTPAALFPCEQVSTSDLLFLVLEQR